CRQCGSPLYLENTTCFSCGSSLGFSRDERARVPDDADGRYVDADAPACWRSANGELVGCTWLTRADGQLCSSCRLTRSRPNDEDIPGLRAFKSAEAAKRRLIVELDALELPIVTRSDDPRSGLVFDLLSSAREPVST